MRDKYGNTIVLDGRDPNDYKVGDIVRYDRVKNRLHKKHPPGLIKWTFSYFLNMQFDLLNTRGLFLRGRSLMFKHQKSSKQVVKNL